MGSWQPERPLHGVLVSWKAKVFPPKWHRNPNRKWASIAGSKTSCITSICATARRSTKAGKHVFEEPRPRPMARRHAGRVPAAIPAPEPAPGEQLLPLRGAAGRIAENMAASVSIPLATSQRTIAVKVMDENRPHHQPAPHPRRQQQGFLHAPDRLGDRQSARRNPRSQPRLRGTRRPAVPRGAAAGQPRHRHRRAGQGRRAQPDGAEHQERRRAQFPGIRHAPSTTWWRARDAANSHPPISRAPPFRSPTPARSAPCRPIRG